MEAVVAITGVVGLAALVNKFTSFLTHVVNRQVNKATKQLVVWIAGVVAVLLYAHSDFGASIIIGSTPLARLDGSAQVILGLAIGSIASALLHDRKAALDNTDTATEGPLVAGDRPSR